MCIRAGSNELESVKNLMAMSLMAVISETLETDIDAIEESSNLRQDLGMDDAGKARLEQMIADYFDGLEINLNTTPTVATLLERVVMSEFSDASVRQYVGIDALEHTPHAA